ncbi:glycosyl hydrolase family 2 [Actinocorallia herbida]|uniref:Glycosyl hydrolase family 2 n=1 Tax=Actinocorallia herbida TaxID=58109 RepID=A0A3N1CWF7_9ACTN|nr:sugar-binding domain-containing protein [Actinocorallia herbida]ROO85629.1 glycosyl hydrolase family 2 [Actinocorallia herbida]
MLDEYPRPQLARDGHLNLNGRWDYAITAADAAEPVEYDGEIVVPYSPEAELSGVGRTLLPDQALWYRRTLEPPEGFLKDRVLLHFGAVDQSCEVLLNGVAVGGHVGGYLPFALDVTEALTQGENTLVVKVRDISDAAHHSRGKQRGKHGGIWYTPQSGIWQTVWAESVPTAHVRDLVIVPQLAEGCVEITVCAERAEGLPARVDVLRDGVVIAGAEAVPGEPVRLPVADVRPWTPEDPFLYDLEVHLGDDRVRSYFGMRSFGVGPDASGLPRLLLNGRPYFHAGVLDQGYWEGGLYTPPSDAAMARDIQAMKDLGFTMLRKHAKIEPLRWYHHCDRLGMLVWQDMVNGGEGYRPAVVTVPAVAPFVRLRDSGARALRRFGRADAEGRAEFERELRDTVEHLRNVVGLAVWVPFNEGWGQFDAARIAADLAALDPTRTVDHASGWHDQGGGDLHSLHVYFRRFRVPARRARLPRRDTRVLALTEYGGYSLPVEGHRSSARLFGYRRYTSPDALTRAFVRLHEQQIIPAIPHGLSATVYTQLSDVQDEMNGLLTQDREVTKLDAEAVRAVTSRLRYE